MRSRILELLSNTNKMSRIGMVTGAGVFGGAGLYLDYTANRVEERGSINQAKPSLTASTKWSIIAPMTGSVLGFIGGGKSAKFFGQMATRSATLVDKIPDNLGIVSFHDIKPSWVDGELFKLPDDLMRLPLRERRLWTNISILPRTIPSSRPGYKFIQVIDDGYGLVENEVKTVEWLITDELLDATYGPRRSEGGIDESIEKIVQPSCRYINQLYPADHWSLDNTKDGTCIAFFKFRNKENYAVKLNPTDRRGYRVLITFIGDDNSDIQTTFNRPYTVAEERGLSDVTVFMKEIFKRLGLSIVQSAQAGNNSQSLGEDGVPQIGSTKEPSMPHVHLWARGNPMKEYIPGVPLDGPKPGEMFDMMAKTPHIWGNQKKVTWEPKQLEVALRVFKKAISEYADSPEFKNEFGDSLKITIHQSHELKVEAPSQSVSSLRIW